MSLKEFCVVIINNNYRTIKINNLEVIFLNLYCHSSVMFYEKFKPNEILQPFVECYYIWHSDEPVHNLVVESPPSGFCSIVFNCSDEYFLQNKKYEKLAVPKQFIAGQAIYSYKLFLNGTISIAGIVLRPTALASLFNLPSYEYTEERIPLTTVFKSSFVAPFADKITNSNDPNEKVKLLEEFVMTVYVQHQPELDCIDHAANLIIERNGMVHISDILKEVFMSRRNFERRFFKKVGLSPKYYSRIIRMGYIFNIIAGKKKVNWQEIFLLCEHYDQSHFIKDFMAFTGRTPQQYIEENQELANLVKKPSIHSIKY